MAEPFRYIVFGMMNTKLVAGTAYADILADPAVPRRAPEARLPAARPAETGPRL